MNPQENVPMSGPAPVPQPPVPPVKLGKFAASKMIVKESWNVLKHDRELALFPLISAIVGIGAFVVISAVFFFVVLGGDFAALETMEENNMGIVNYAILFVYYVVMFFITNYFLAGMYIIINARFNGQDLSFGEGINGANANLGKIFMWSVISATVGVVLQFISDRSKMIGTIVSAIFGAAWGILTYFSLPSLIIGQTSVRGSFKESASIIRKTWGETIIVNFGVGLFFGILFFLGIIVAVSIIVLVPVKAIMILVGMLLVVYFILLAVISSALNSIFKLALYQFAKTGTIPQGFSPELLQGAVQKGK